MADYAALLRNKVGSAIQKLGTINTRLTYVHVVPGNYNPATGTVAATTTSIGPVEVPVVRADEKEAADFPAAKNVEIVLFPYSLLQGLTISRNDYFLVEGVHWEILRVRRFPTDAFTKCYVGTP